MRLEVFEKLPSDVAEILEFIQKTGWRQDRKIYLVGGVVRDILLGRDSQDIDIVVEGHASAVARETAKRYNAEIVEHPRFLTATVKFRWGEVDFSTARRERYPKPASLPDVEPGRIEDDLKRRDFSINAIAVSLNSEGLFSVLDPFHGVEDLRSGIMRILHRKSFTDDPTRAFRAIRYMARFGFNMEPLTKRLLAEARDNEVLNNLTGSRIFNEMKLLLSEPAPDICVILLKKYGILRFFSEHLTITSKMLKTLSRISQIVNEFPLIEKWRVCMIALLKGSGENRIKDTIKMYPVDARLKQCLELLEDFNYTLKVIGGKKIKNSRLYELLEKFPDELILYGMAYSETAGLWNNLQKFLSELKAMTAPLDGGDLRSMGIPAGPAYSKILRELLFKRLDGEITTKNEAKKLVKVVKGE